SIGAAIGVQIANLAGNLPQYETNISDKIQSLRSTTLTSGILGRASTMLKDLSNEVTKPAEEPNKTGAKAPASQPPNPIPVEIHLPAPTALQIIQTIIGPLLQPLATAGIVIVFVIFFLL